MDRQLRFGDTLDAVSLIHITAKADLSYPPLLPSTGIRTTPSPPSPARAAQAGKQQHWQIASPIRLSSHSNREIRLFAWHGRQKQSSPQFPLLTELARETGSNSVTPDRLRILLCKLWAIVRPQAVAKLHVVALPRVLFLLPSAGGDLGPLYDPGCPNAPSPFPSITGPNKTARAWQPSTKEKQKRESASSEARDSLSGLICSDQGGVRRGTARGMPR